MRDREWYRGPWRAEPFRKVSLARPEMGVVMDHVRDDGTPSGFVVLRCPACHTVGFMVGQVAEADPATVDRALHCGCSRCGVDFAITGGVAVPVEPKAPTYPDPPAGTKRPPLLDCNGSTIHAGA